MNKKSKQLVNKVKRADTVSRYQKLAVRLGKLPSFRECARHGLSERQILGHFNGIAELKEVATSEMPGLNEVCVPAQLTTSDIENYRIGLEKKKTKKQNGDFTKSADLLDYVEEFSNKVFAGKISPIKPYKSKKKTKRNLTLVISDTHFGADLKSEETGVREFGKLQESRRIAAITEEVINYKAQYRDETELDVLLLGDIIQGSLHDPRDGASLAEQMARAIHLLSQMLTHFSGNFKKVRVHCTTGNHGRNKARHYGRAVNQKWDSNETIVYYALKKILAPQTNVEFSIPKTPYGEFSVFGQRILYTHGDTVLKPGYPNSSINIKSLETQINSINSSLSDQSEYKAVVVGHVHTCSQTYLGNGSVMMTNGALIPPDEFAVSIGIMESQTGQLLFESVPEFAVGDTRFIRVGEKQDNDAELDKIIKPFESL